MKRAEEMTPLLETVESQHQASHSFPQALGNLANTARFPHSLSSCDYDCTWKLITLTTGASRTRGLLSYLTQPTPVWVTSLNDLTGPFQPTRPVVNAIPVCMAGACTANQ